MDRISCSRIVECFQQIPGDAVSRQELVLWFLLFLAVVLMLSQISRDG